VAAGFPSSGLAAARRVVSGLVISGQHSVHMNSENLAGRKRIVTALAALVDVGLEVAVWRLLYSTRGAAADRAASRCAAYPRRRETRARSPRPGLGLAS
jgi:hypothetical protein